MIEKTGNIWSIWNLPTQSNIGGYLLPSSISTIGRGKSSQSIQIFTNAGTASSTPVKKDRHIVLCTTNNIKRKTGELVMGAGIAKQALARVGGLDKIIGDSFSYKEDYHIRIFLDKNIGCIQTKRFWGDPSPMDLVKDSIIYLNIIARSMPDINFHLPRVGCGLGGLNWEKDVKEFASILPDSCMVWNV